MRSKIRDIKLDIVLGNPNEIVNEFIRITNGIHIMNVPVYNSSGQEFIWYVGEKWLFYQDLKNDSFWCNYDNYWSIFISKFNLNRHDIQSITKFMVETALKNVECAPWNLARRVETALKNVVGTPHCMTGNSILLVETALKNVVGTPHVSVAHHPGHQVETAFKNVVGTPLMRFVGDRDMVETAFKNVVGTPYAVNVFNAPKVETAFKNVVGTPLPSRPSDTFP